MAISEVYTIDTNRNNLFSEETDIGKELITKYMWTCESNKLNEINIKCLNLYHNFTT